MLKDVSDTLQNFKFIGATVLEIPRGSGRPPCPLAPLVSGVGTKRFGTGRVNPIWTGGGAKWPPEGFNYISQERFSQSS